MTPLPRSLACAACLMALTPAGRAAEPWELLKYAPPASNSVTVVNVASLLASPRAVRDGWSKLEHTEYLAGAIPLHPSVERAIVIKELNPHALGKGGAVAVLPLRKAVDLETLTKTTGGTLTPLGEEQAVVTPNGAVMVPLADAVLGSAWGGTKQQVAAWVRSARESTKSPLPRYLTSTIADNATRHHIVTAVLVQDLFDGPQVAGAVAATQSLAADPQMTEAVRRFVAGLQGVLFTASVTNDGVAVRVRLDSTVIAGTMTADALKAFMVELFDRNGARLEDLPAATVTVNGRVASFAFRVNDAELANIMHLFLPPLARAAESGAIAVAPAGPNGASTARYFQGVNRQVADLRRRSENATDPSAIALWYDTTANAILTTSVVGVDQAAVDFARGTAGRLHMLADSLRGQPLQLAQLESQAYLFVQSGGGMGWFPGRGMFFNPWGMGGNVNTNLPQIRSKQIELIRQDAENRTKVWDQINKERESVRLKLSAAYGIDLDRPGR
ncbi:MAG: hypothetical protein U0871_16505 [Gemmataceae bacterium]